VKVGLIVSAGRKQVTMSERRNVMLHWFAKRLREVQEVPRDERGFTLIELLVVVIIIGILAAIAIPVFLSQRERAEDAAAQGNLRSAATAQEAYYSDPDGGDGSYAADGEEDELESAGFRQGDPPVTIVSGDDSSYCMEAGDYRFDSDEGRPLEGNCGAAGA
jgi:type IV pilus assembly protein PilA